MLYQDLADDTLVMMTLGGEQSAYEALVLRYERAVRATAYKVTQNTFTAEDAAQDAFVTAWMKMDTLREPAKFGSWVCRIAHHCAQSLMRRYQECLSLEEVDEALLARQDAEVYHPQTRYLQEEETRTLHNSVDRLPRRVKEIIRLHYFEGLSILEIADRMHITEGAVKSQLHEGRKRLRKDLCSMDKEMNDTLLRRVMKNVEELKLWACKNKKTDMAAAYRDVLREVEALPESTDKYHAMADVLIRGWWWVEGENKEALYERIREVAERGKNDEVMRFIAIREDARMNAHNRIAFIRDKQIPRLRAGGYVKALGSEWFWLARAYIYQKQLDQAQEALTEAVRILPASDIYTALANELLESLLPRYAQNLREPAKRERTYQFISSAERYRAKGDTLCAMEEHCITAGELYSVDMDMDRVFYNASRCDGLFTVPGLHVGETHVGTDGTLLSFVNDSATVDTPAGHFEECQLWELQQPTCRLLTYYKADVGIVRQERHYAGIMEFRNLSSYRITGGSGLIPCARGNEWTYTGAYPSDIMLQDTRYRVHYAQDGCVLLRCTAYLERLRYDDNSWLDMILQIRSEYWNGHACCDVSHAIERAGQLAVTPMQKAHTKAACSVARRILDTNPEFNPAYTASGHWNFFGRFTTAQEGNRILLSHDFRWNFELKCTDGSDTLEAILYNDPYDILYDNVQCLWSHAWKIGFTDTVEFLMWGQYHVCANLTCEDGGTVTTPAGTFENCLRLSLETTGMPDGIKYRGGKKEYYFAEGIGLVRVVNHYAEDILSAVYDLTDYEGTGTGYMPLEDGMMRRYDAQELLDGYVAHVTYTYVADEQNVGQMVIFKDACGIRKKPDKITSYGDIFTEHQEKELWEQGHHDTARQLFAMNTLRLLSHTLYRPRRYEGRADLSVAWNEQRLHLIESFGGGEISPAFLGCYAATTLRLSCALFAMGRREEGYTQLDRAMELFVKWDTYPNGEALDVGAAPMYEGIKMLKCTNILLLPDGSKDLLYESLTHETGGLVYNALTMPSGWEWFDNVREEPRFKDAVARATTLFTH